MAKIRDYAFTIYTATTANMVCEMPVHQSGDLLVAFVNKDSASNFTTPSTSVGTPVSSGNWTALQTQTSAGAGGGVYAFRATSSSENVTFPLTLETCVGVVISIQDVYGSTVADAIPTSAKSGADDSTLPLTGIGLTAGYANSLLLHGLSTDSGFGPNALPPWINIFAGDAGANSLCVSYSFTTATGAITAPDHWGNLQDDSRGFMIEVRDGSSGTSIPCYLPLSTTPARQISPINGSATTAVEKGAYIAANSITLTSIAGKTVTGVTVGTAVADSGINPFRGSNNIAGASSTTNLAHTEFVLTTTDNLTQLEGLVFGTWFHATPRDYVDSGKATQGGKYLVIGNDASNYKCWVIGGQFTKTDKPDARNNYLIEVATSDTVYGSAGSPDYSTADFFAFGSAGYYGAVAQRFNEMYLLGVANIAGGSSTTPINFDDVIFAVNNGCGILPLMVQAGAGATCWISLQFGGVSKIGISCNLNTFQFPQKADEDDYVDFHVSNNKMGFEFYGIDSNDSLVFTNCLFTSPSPYYWRFNSSHSANSLINFSGTSVVNATVTLRSTSNLDSVTFIDCPTFTQNGATLTNCSFSNTKVTTSSPANAALISNSSFESAGTGHAIEIGGTAANITLTGITFTDYAGSNGSTGNEAIYVNIANGNMTIGITGGGNIPSIRTAGATVTVINSVDITVRVVDSSNSPVENAQTAIYKTSDGAELMNQDTIANGTATTSFNYTADTNIYIRVRKSSTGATKYYPASTTGTITSSGFSTTITLIEDTTA